MAINKGRHRRDALVNLLWPEHGKAALHRTLSALRKAFGDPLPDSGQSQVARSSLARRF
jgi:DNA-binding SARP family transcriptional activator